MKARFVLSTVVSVLVAAACLPLTDEADGAACEDDGECKSHRCRDGFCSGSKCELNDPSDCEAGWKCTHNDPDPLTGAFGNDGTDTCKPTCGHCPGNHHCPDGAPAGTLCSYGKAPLALQISAENAVVGRKTKVIAKAASGARIVECNWNLGDGKEREKTTGPEIERVFDSARTYRAEVSCTSDTGADGFVQQSFEVVCTPSGEACVPGTCCADKTMRCVTGTCRVPVPPTVVISGPLTIPIREVGTYSVALTGGDGKATQANWHFTDTFVQQQGFTITHDFDEAGDNEVKVAVDTDIGTQVGGTLTVNVCQVDGGRCTGSVKCCAPLTCQGTSIPTCQP